MPEKKRVTIRDIAREAGVSTATISRYLNSPDLVDSNTADKIKDVISRFSYRPNRAAQSLKTGDNRSILLIVPDIANPVYGIMAKNIQILANAEGYAITLYNTSESSDKEMEAIALATEMSASGILFASIDATQSMLEAIRRSGIPAVSVSSYENRYFDFVHGVQGISTYLTTRYLLSLGHRCIALAGGVAGTVIACSRKTGYTKALDEASVPLDKSLVFEMGFSDDAGYKAGKYFSTLRPLPTAICCANDLLAIGVIQALKEAGVQVPGDVSVTGVDNIPYARALDPALTTVTNDSEKFAQAAITMLFDRINHTYSGGPREVKIVHELVVRRSTAAPCPERTEQEDRK